MSRTTVDIDLPILRDLRVLQSEEGKSLGRLVSELLAEALARRAKTEGGMDFRWITRPMGIGVELEDEDAVH